MDVNITSEIKDGEATRSLLILEAPSIVEVPKLKLEGNVKKKRRRGKTKRKILKPFLKVPWKDRRKIDNSKRNNRFRKIIITKTQAPFNNNQFLMEIHKPEPEIPENNFQLFQTPSARTRDSSFSVDSEENYFYSLPEDEEEYLTKEFSSVYEDAQCERLSSMSKNELIQEYLLLEAKYDNLVKRNERAKPKDLDDEKTTTSNDKEMTVLDKDNMPIEKETKKETISSSLDDPSLCDIMQRLKEQEQQILELQLANEKLLVENSHLRQRSHGSSEDSESDSSSSSDTCSTSSCSSPEHAHVVENGDVQLNENIVPVNGNHNMDSPESAQPLVNGFHSPNN